MTNSIQCHFVNGGWKFYADTAEGRTQCANEYTDSVGYTNQGHLCVCQDAGPRNAYGCTEVVVRMRASVASLAVAA